MSQATMLPIFNEPNMLYLCWIPWFGPHLAHVGSLKGSHPLFLTLTLRHFSCLNIFLPSLKSQETACFYLAPQLRHMFRQRRMRSMVPRSHLSRHMHPITVHRVKTGISLTKRRNIIGRIIGHIELPKMRL